MKIFRYSNFPTDNSPGSGLAAYHLSQHSDLTSYILCKDISEQIWTYWKLDIPIHSLSANSFIYRVKNEYYLKESLYIIGYIFENQA